MSIQEVTFKLEQMNEVHGQLIDLGGQKKQALIYNNINELSLIMKQESKLMKLVTECERERHEATVRFYHGKGIQPSSAITISELAKMVFQLEEKTALLDAQKRLVETILKLKKINEFNQELIRQSLAFIDYSLDLVTGSFEQDTVYHNPAQHTQDKLRVGSFDYKG